MEANCGGEGEEERSNCSGGGFQTEVPWRAIMRYLEKKRCK